MKKLIIGMFLLLQISAHAMNVKDLEVKCKIQAKVTDVSDIKYSPGKPAHYRVPEIPATLHFKASLEIVSQDESCSVLQSKYKIFLGRLHASGEITPASEDQISEILALQNQLLELTLKQQIGFQSGSGYLPLFPQVHSEKLSLSFNADGISGMVPLPFEVSWVYGITKIENMTDIGKLALAEKAAWMALKDDFHGLFLQLEPSQENLKKAYAQLIWKIFKQPKAREYLQFHVGGWGSYTGRPLAQKLNGISHIDGIFSSKEIVQLMTDFPTWILSGYSGKECLNFTTADLELVLENAKVKAPVMTAGESWMWKDSLEQISGATSFVSNCTQGKVSDYAKALATELLKK